MARANPTYDRINRYLKQEFPWQLNLSLIPVRLNPPLFDFYSRLVLQFPQPAVIYCLLVNLNRIVEYHDVKQILKKLMVKEPHLYLNYQYMWLSYQKRNNKAEALFCDSSTFKRNCDKMCEMIMKDICQLLTN